MTKALYLSGGGARAAYQVGVLKGIQEIMQFKSRIPVEILCCVSAGAINGSVLAMYGNDFPTAVKKLEDIWRGLKCDNVFKANNWAIFKSVFRQYTSFLVGYQPKAYLLDTAPLAELIAKHVDFHQVNQMVRSGVLKAMEVAANCYDLAETVSFFNSQNPFISWRRVRHISYRTDIELEHILASSAIPLFFKPIKLGVLHYGDGTMRLSTPLRGAIQFGASDIFIISTRAVASAHELVSNSNSNVGQVSFGKILGSMMNALFLDNLDRDLEMLENLNRRLKLGKITSSHWRFLNTEVIHPSVDLGAYASSYEKNVALALRILMRSLGTSDESSDFLSFLLFDGDYAGKLIEIGLQDALSKADEIEQFFNPK